jgi:hypothetical protein
VLQQQQGMPSTSRRVPLGTIAAALYLVSLFLPAIIVRERPRLWDGAHDETMFGAQCLMIGWLTVPWYANVALWFASIALAFRRHELAIALSILAVGLALSTLVYLGDDLHGLHVGYFAWLGSMVLVFVAACVGARRRFALREG